MPAPLPEEILANETIVLGGVVALLGAMPGATVALPWEDGPLPWNAAWLRLDYMTSRYRVTVTWDPEPGDIETLDQAQS